MTEELKELLKGLSQQHSMQADYISNVKPDELKELREHLSEWLEDLSICIADIDDYIYDSLNR